MKRMTRSEYWIMQLLVLPILVCTVAGIGFITFPKGGHGVDILMYGVFMCLCALGIVVLNILSVVRRLKDAGQSPFWILATFVPAISFIAWFVIGILPTKN